MSAPILHLSVSQRPVFLLNSRLSLFSAATCVAPLLPKLRGHFAEFLNNTSPVGLWIFSSSTCVGFNNTSPVGLWIFSSSTCVGLRYGYVSHNSGFSRQCGFGNFPTFVQSPSHFIIKRRIFLSPLTLCLAGFFHSPVFLSSCVPTVLMIRSTGISTCYPSTTTFVLALGPD